MKNLNQFTALDKKELTIINGGCQIRDCWPENPFKFPKKSKDIPDIE